jgi:hypothetical protein
VAFSVEPSHSPSGSFVPSVPIPSATTFGPPCSSIPSFYGLRDNLSRRTFSARVAAITLASLDRE